MNFSVLAIFKNESHIMNEWIEHYLNEGADDLILIDNESDDDWKTKIKQEYLESDCIRFYSQKGEAQQRPVYAKYFSHAKNNWVLICDLDEFLYSRKEYNTVSDYLSDIKDDNITNILVPWKVYGHCGFKKQPDRVVENFVKRWENSGRIVCVKSLVRKDRCIKTDLHNSFYNVGHAIDPLGNMVPNHPHMKVSEEYLEKLPLVMNHYVVQSEEYYWNVKVRRGKADFTLKDGENVIPRDEEFFNNHGSGEYIDEELKNKKYK